LDGKEAIDWDDKTFTEAGMVGVWTKADSVTLLMISSMAASNASTR